MPGERELPLTLRCFISHAERDGHHETMKKHAARFHKKKQAGQNVNQLACPVCRRPGSCGFNECKLNDGTYPLVPYVQRYHWIDVDYAPYGPGPQATGPLAQILTTTGDGEALVTNYADGGLPTPGTGQVQIVLPTGMSFDGALPAFALVGFSGIVDSNSTNANPGANLINGQWIVIPTGVANQWQLVKLKLTGWAIGDRIAAKIYISADFVPTGPRVVEIVDISCPENTFNFEPTLFTEIPLIIPLYVANIGKPRCSNKKSHGDCCPKIGVCAREVNKYSLINPAAHNVTNKNELVEGRKLPLSIPAGVAGMRFSGKHKSIVAAPSLIQSLSSEDAEKASHTDISPFMNTTVGYSKDALTKHWFASRTSAKKLRFEARKEKAARIKAERVTKLAEQKAAAAAKRRENDAARLSAIAAATLASSSSASKRSNKVVRQQEALSAPPAVAARRNAPVTPVVAPVAVVQQTPTKIVAPKPVRMAAAAPSTVKSDATKRHQQSVVDLRKAIYDRKQATEEKRLQLLAEKARVAAATSAQKQKQRAPRTVYKAATPDTPPTVTASTESIAAISAARAKAVADAKEKRNKRLEATALAAQASSSNAFVVQPTESSILDGDLLSTQEDELILSIEDGETITPGNPDQE